MSVVSIVPSLFLFDLAPEETARVHRVINDAAAAYAAAGDGRIVAMATVPMNDPAAASEELRRAHDELGLHGVEVGTSVEGVMVDDPELDPLFATAERLGVPIMLHPYASMIGDPPAGFRGFHLSNVIGNPLETCVAASRLLVGGVFDRHPELRVLLVHAGGSFPYQLGRLDHAYDVREETQAVARRRPSAYLENLVFDTIAFDPRALEFLVSVAGSNRLVFGTDSPFDMKDLGTRDNLASLPLDAQEDILGANAIRLFGLQGDARAQAASGERSRP
jgi:aminocarboxymuconate-semialdehyde decarboxylase